MKAAAGERDKKAKCGEERWRQGRDGEGRGEGEIRSRT